MEGNRVFTAAEKSSIRENYPVTRNCIYLNHAAVGSLSSSSYEAMESHARGQRDHGVRDWRGWNATISDLRESAARLLAAEPSDVAILKNTSEGLSLVASGLPWQRGDNVVFSDMEFPSNSLPWLALEKKGVECRRIVSSDGQFDVGSVASLVDSETRVVSISSVSFHNGFRPDLRGISEACRENGAHLVVDAIQSLGALQIDVRELNISFLAADGHKWMLGPEGVALFYASEESRAELGAWPVGWRSLEKPQVAFGSGVPVTKESRRFEAGVPNTNGCYGLEASLRYLLEIGVDRIEKEIVRLASRLVDGLKQIGWQVLSPTPQMSGIVSARPTELTGKEAFALEADLDSKGVVVAGRMGALRFSPHFYNTDEEIDRVVEILSGMSQGESR